MSKREELLTKIINNEPATETPTSRSEQYLTAIANGSGAENLPTPISREDKLLKTIAENGIGGGGGGITPSGSVDIVANGQYDVTSYAEANVNVEYKTQDKEVRVTENGSQTIYADEGYDAISSVTVSVDVSESTSGDMLQARVDATNNCDYLFYNYAGNTLDFISNLDTSRVTSMASMYNSCTEITSINMNVYNTSNVRNMQGLCSGCSKLTNVNLKGMDTSKLQRLDGAFKQCSSLTNMDLSDLHVNNMTHIHSMFEKCTQLTQVTFGQNWKNNSIEAINNLFSNCSALVSVDWGNLGVDNVTTTYAMCSGCTSLVTLDLSTWNLNASSVNIGMIVNGCTKLETFALDIRNVTQATNVFNGCKALTNLMLKNIKTTLTIGSGTSYGHLLTVDSLVNTIKELWDHSDGETTYKLTMGTTNMAKLADVYVKLVTVTEENMAVDPYIKNKKPCEVCESTDEGAMLISDYTQLKNWQIQ